MRLARRSTGRVRSSLSVRRSIARVKSELTLFKLSDDVEAEIRLRPSARSTRGTQVPPYLCIPVPSVNDLHFIRLIVVLIGQDSRLVAKRGWRSDVLHLLLQPSDTFATYPVSSTPFLDVSSRNYPSHSRHFCNSPPRSLPNFMDLTYPVTIMGNSPSWIIMDNG